MDACPGERCDATRGALEIRVALVDWNARLILCDSFTLTLQQTDHSKPSLIRLQFMQMSDDPVQNMENENFCSQLSTLLEKTHGI